MPTTLSGHAAPAACSMCSSATARSTLPALPLPAQSPAQSHQCSPVTSSNISTGTKIVGSIHYGALHYMPVSGKMKSVAITLIALPFFAACSSTPDYTQTSRVMDDGATHHFIKTRLGPCPTSRDWAVRTLTKRANEVCKSGYVLINQQEPIILDQMRASVRESELSWQIKCRNPETRKR